MASLNLKIFQIFKTEDFFSVGWTEIFFTLNVTILKIKKKKKKKKIEREIISPAVDFQSVNTTLIQ